MNLTDFMVMFVHSFMLMSAVLILRTLEKGLEGVQHWYNWYSGFSTLMLVHSDPGTNVNWLIKGFFWLLLFYVHGTLI